MTRDLEAAVQYISILPLLDVDDPQFQAQGEMIARACGDFETFEALDERPGEVSSPWNDYRSKRAGEWHIKLRRARNHCERFFDQLQGGRA